MSRLVPKSRYLRATHNDVDQCLLPARFEPGNIYGTDVVAAEEMVNLYLSTRGYHVINS